MQSTSFCCRLPRYYIETIELKGYQYQRVVGFAPGKQPISIEDSSKEVSKKTTRIGASVIKPEKLNTPFKKEIIAVALHASNLTEGLKFKFRKNN